MIRLQQLQLILRLRKYIADQIAEARVEAASAATSFGEQEPAAIDVHPQLFLVVRGELRRVSAIEEDDRCFEQIFNGRRIYVDDLVREISAPSLLNVSDEVSERCPMPIPIVLRLNACAFARRLRD